MSDENQYFARPLYRILAAILALAFFFGAVIAGYPMIQNGVDLIRVAKVVAFAVFGVGLLRLALTGHWTGTSLRNNDA